MAKKKAEPREPIISSIPVPPSDSALVIDLPDGQKLLVGKIESGTVIEVATWRGTGRPDSRTNRLMLGMSNEKDVPQESDSESNSTVPKAKFPQNLIPIVANSVKALIRSISKGFSLLNKRINLKFEIPKMSSWKKGESKIKDSNVLPSRLIEEDFDADFQRILDQVANRRNAQSPDEGKPLAKSAVRGKQSTKKASGKSKKSNKAL